MDDGPPLTGAPFRWLRPAQDCSESYGRRIHVCQVARLTPDEYAERPLYTIEPQWTPGLLATHTLNTAGGLTVIDGCRPRGKFW